MSDKWGRYSLMYVGLVFVLLAETVLVWGYGSGNWEVVFSFLALASVGVGVYAPSALALLGDLSPKNAYGYAMGTYDFLLSVSEISGPVVTGALVAWSGFSTLAVFGIIVTLVNILVIHFRPGSRATE